MRDPWFDNRAVALVLMLACAGNAWATLENDRLAARLTRMAVLAEFSRRSAEPPRPSSGTITIDPGSVSAEPRGDAGGAQPPLPLQTDPGVWL
jgi:hypothetical protein